MTKASVCFSFHIYTQNCELCLNVTLTNCVVLKVLSVSERSVYVRETGQNS